VLSRKVTQPLPARDNLVARMIQNSHVTVLDPVTERWKGGTKGLSNRFVNRGVGLMTLEGIYG
jgi:hypothetical protein